MLLFCCCNDDKFRQILFSQVQFTNQHTTNMKTLLILVILLAEQKMAISSEMNKRSAATEWWKGAPTSFLPSSPAAIEVAKEKQNKEEGPDHLTNGRHGILSIYFPRSFFLTIPIRTIMLWLLQGRWKVFLMSVGKYYVCNCARIQKSVDQFFVFTKYWIHTLPTHFHRSWI